MAKRKMARGHWGDSYIGLMVMTYIVVAERGSVGGIGGDSYIGHIHIDHIVMAYIVVAERAWPGGIGAITT